MVAEHGVRDDSRVGHQYVNAAADPDHLAALLLTVVRGIEAVGKAGLGPEALRGVADTAMAVLPGAGRNRPEGAGTGEH
ncbi:hypothetical protein [Streptomyces albidoflavus]|uniref:hypothetical protein n=1 Tax=Streptomyces albidoflavus TaxID=1886 RepID=UPI003F4D2966